MYQFAMFIEQRQTGQDVLVAAARRLALHVYLMAVLDAREGDDEAREWLATAGRELAEDLGLASLARLSVDVLVASANKAELLAVLGHETRHCRDCAHLACADGRCQCALGMWAQQGRNREYAQATVLHDTRGFLRPCNHWMEVQRDDDPIRTVGGFPCIYGGLGSTPRQRELAYGDIPGRRVLAGVDGPDDQGE